MSTSRPSLSVVGGGGGVAGAVPDLAAHGDDELMLLARGGVAEAFDVLIRRYQGQVLRLAARHLGSAGAAADVAQNAFLAIYRAIPRYQARGRFAAYLYQTVLNECRMTHRWYRARGGGATGRLAAGAVPEPEAIASAASSAEAMILERERERDVAAAVTRLSRKLRDVVSLRYGAGLSYDEIADALELPVGTVKRRVFDAMEKLRCELRES